MTVGEMKNILFYGIPPKGLTNDDITGPRAPRSFAGTNHQWYTGLETWCETLVCRSISSLFRCVVDVE
jgi:hypothetical protein